MQPLGREKSLQKSLKTSQRWLNKRTQRDDLRVFPTYEPITIFVSGTRCNIAIQYHALDQAEVHARFYNAFGLRFITAQDEAGIYIVLKRRRFWGLISRADVVLKVPSYANLSFDLKRGAVRLDDINGLINVPPLPRETPLSLAGNNQHQPATLLEERTSQ